MFQLETYSVAAVTSGAAAISTATLYAAQIVLTPENVWIPFGLVLGLVGFSVWTTVRAVRVFDRLTTNQNQLMKEVNEIKETLKVIKGGSNG